MNAEALAQVERAYAEIEAAVREEHKNLSLSQLIEIGETMLHNPNNVWVAACNNPNKLVALAAATVYREILRRVEVEAMEVTQ